MPRSPRIAPGGVVYHVINHASGKLRLFRKDEDFQAFYRVLLKTHERLPLPLLGWCVMKTHWHFVVRPRSDSDLSKFFGYLSLTHAVRWQAAHDAVGTGHVYQGRFKSFAIQEDEHLRSVLRYVERSPLREGLVPSAQSWPYSSLHARLKGPEPIRSLLTPWPISRPADWVRQVNRAQSDAEEQAIETSLQRGRPLGDDRWVARMVKRHGLESTIRPRGRQPGWRKARTK